MAMKGVDTFIAATMLILVTVIVATLVSSWTVNVTSERAKTIVNATQGKLNCQFAGMLAKNVIYDCNSACFTGSPYRINATIENTGSSKILVESMFISLANGLSYKIDGNLSQISTGDIITKLFDSVAINTSARMPAETMDMRGAYVNGTNTIGLWHFDDASGNTAADASRGNTGTLYNGSVACSGAAGQCPLWGSGLFGYALGFDGINDYLLLNASGFSNSTGTVEAWINMNVNGPSNNYTILSVPSQTSGSDGGLAALWHFSENSTAAGGVKDSSPYGNNGTVIAGPNFTTEGRFGSAFSFDGINDYISVPSYGGMTFNGSDSFTITAWVKHRGSGSGDVIDKEGSFTIPFRFIAGPGSGPYIEFRNITGYNPTCNGALPMSNNTWHFVAGVKDVATSQLRVYLNGVLSKACGVPMVNYTDANGALVIGSRGGSGNFYNGSIDEIAVYSRVLSEAEIRDRYLGGLSIHKIGDNLRFAAGNLSLSYNVSAWSGWHHVAGTYTSTDAVLYADGAPVNASSNRGSAMLGSDAYIGGLNGTIAFNGTIDEVRISNMSRAFNVSLQYNITLPDIIAVRLYNSSNNLVNEVTSLGALARYNKTLTGLSTSTEYRVQAEDAGGSKTEKWYPYRPGGACVSTGQLDKIQFSTVNCPEATDAYPGTDVSFANCVG